MNRRSFLKAAASGAALLSLPKAEAALPAARITRINIYETPNVMPLQIPLLQSSMVVVIETDANLTGIGEGGTRDTLEPWRREGSSAKIRFISSAVGKTCTALHYPPGERLHAMVALDMALWDLKAKALDVPVYELLGGLNRNYLECYTTTFRGGGNNLRDQAAACLQAGYRLFRLDAASVPGGNTFAAERVRQVEADCRAVREGVGQNGNFMIDFHQRFTFAHALCLPPLSSASLHGRRPRASRFVPSGYSPPPQPDL